MSKSKTPSDLARRKTPSNSFRIRRPFSRHFIYRLLPLVKNQPPQQITPHSTADKKDAYHEIHLISDGRLVLSEGNYLGDDTRHLLFCNGCSNHIMASLNEVKDGPACPHCLGDIFLNRFSTIKQMQKYCLDASLQGAYFLGRNRVGGTMDEARNFFCMIHKESYQTSMNQFFTDSRGCPCCILAIKKPP